MEPLIKTKPPGPNAVARIASSTEATATFKPPGNYTIQLTVGGEVGLSTASKTVTVRPSQIDRQSDGNTTIEIPYDPTSSPNGHFYRAVFGGSTQLAASTSASISSTTITLAKTRLRARLLPAVIVRSRFT